MQPLAERLRPITLDDYVGQQHLVGKNSVLRRVVESGNINSMIFWGPPGVGKTTLAHILARAVNRPFYELSAISAGVKDVREVIERARQDRFFSEKGAPILFIDEIHRFSKSQQDSLLGAVERGVITLIGATTENPSFEVISALLSRCQVYVLKHLERSDLEYLLQHALEKDEFLQQKNIKIESADALLQASGGDARKLLNALEIVGTFLRKNENEDFLTITNQNTLEILQQNLALYDKNGEQHYDIISAFIKSIRGSDPNAAVYYLARMLAGGEDPLFVARRLVILAAEDIGLANPNALLLAQSTFQGVHAVGMPEARILLSHCTIYLATAAKSNSAYVAIENALAEVKKSGNLPVPLHLRNAKSGLMKELGYGKDYQYAHDFKDNFVEQHFLPENMEGKKFFEPSENPSEEKIRMLLRQLWKNKYDY
ncbi:MAG: hypothetical protein RL757_648 [Bacteroidota bacterium]|jgi:putative ATPase